MSTCLITCQQQEYAFAEKIGDGIRAESAVEIELMSIPSVLDKEVVEAFTAKVEACDFHVMVLAADMLELQAVHQLAGIALAVDLGKEGSRLLPIWYKVGFEEVAAKLPVLLDRFAIISSQAEEVAARLIHIMKASRQEQGQNSWDFFTSFSVEHRKAVVEPLVDQLQLLGHTLWYSGHQLRQETSDIFTKVNHGLLHSRGGLVIVSNHYLEKPWPRLELTSLVKKAVEGEGPLVMVLVQGVTMQTVLNQYPLLQEVAHFFDWKAYPTVAALAKAIDELNKLIL